MKPTVFKRAGAYLLDLVIVTLIVSLLSYIPILNPNRVAFSEKYNELSNLYTQYSKNEISNDEYEEAYIPISYEMYRLNSNYVILDIVIVLLYFGVLPFFTGGQTIGKKLLNLRITSIDDNELTLVNYLLRALILNNIIISIMEIIVVYTMKVDNFFNVYSNINLVGYIITYITLFMVIVKRDNRGLHDLVARTKVIKISEDKIEEEQAILVHEQEIKQEDNIIETKESPKDKKKSTSKNTNKTSKEKKNNPKTKKTSKK